MKVLSKFRCLVDFATEHALVLECVCLLKLKACQGACWMPSNQAAAVAGINQTECGIGIRQYRRENRTVEALALVTIEDSEVGACVLGSTVRPDM